MPTVTIIKPTIETESDQKIRAAAYCRVSSSSDDQINSYMAQMTYYTHKFENSETETLVDLYADEGISGTREDKRPEFQRLIKDCRKGKIDRIYTKSISRFARNTRDCLKNVRELKSLGISIFFEKENIDTANIADEMMITIMGGLAQEESVSISQNMQWSIHKRMQNGTYIASNQPYGYDKADGKLVVNESEANIVRRIYHEYLNGRGLNAICNSLNADGLIMGKSKIIWKKKAVRYILTNEKYIGDCLWRKNYTENVFPFRKPRNRGQADQYYVTDDHEPIISRETFERVQELLKERSELFGNTEFKTYPLTKKIKCGNCGKTFRKKNINGRFYWVCMQHDHAAESCPCKGIAQDVIYTSFIRLFNKLYQNCKAILIPMQTALQELKVRKFTGNVHVIDIHRNMAQLREQGHVIAGLRTKGFLSEEKYQEQTAELNRKISKLQKEMNMLTKSDDEDETLEQIRCSDNSYVIYNYLDNKVIDAHNAIEESNVDVTTFSDTDSQHWYIYSNGNGAVYLQPKNTSNVLDVTSSSSEIGTNVQLYRYNGTNAQHFTIYQVDKADSGNLYIDAGNTIGGTKFWWDKGTACTIYNLRIEKGEPGNTSSYLDKWNLSDTECTVKLPEGYYEAYVDFCNGYSVSMGRKMQFYVSTPVAGVSTISVSPGNKTSPTQFYWTETENTTIYNLRISSVQDGIFKSYRDVWNLTDLSYELVLPIGSYEVYVNACNDENYSTSNRITFDITESIVPEKPIIEVATSNNFNTATELKWNDCKYTDKYA